MLSRITLVLITVFWLCMNFLLWRSEFGGPNHLGVKVPVAAVWQKILTAPDNCRLHILHHGKETGTCQWSANIGQELTGSKIFTDNVPPDGPPQKLTGYRIDFEGNFAVSDNPNRLGFGISIIFTTNHIWQEFSALLKLRPDAWVAHSRASEKTLHVRMESEDEQSDRVYKFSDLQNPRFLAQEFQLPIALQLLDAVGLPVANPSAAQFSLGLVWEARTDWITLGNTSVRAYRLQARLLDHYRIIVMVSEVGEILRVELPDDWVLVNDQFSDF